MALRHDRRQALIPPYMEDVVAWTQLMEAVDEVFSKVDDASIWIGWLRDLWLLSDPTLDLLEQGDVLIDSSGFMNIERDILIRQANMLGFRASDPSVFSNADYQRIVRFLPQYWYEQGTQKLGDFIGFILDAEISITPMWSQNTQEQSGLYSGFVLPSQAGTPVWKGGTWFPTTHVTVQIPAARYTSDSREKVVQIFNALANFNLVLHSVDQDYIIDVRDVNNEQEAKIVVVEAVVDQIQDVPTNAP